MIMHLLIGGIVIAITVVFQAIAFDLIIRKINYLKKKIRLPLYDIDNFKRSILLTIVVLEVFCVIVIEIWIWAILYMGIGAFNDLETALYFSTSSFTTVGFGDVVLGKDWRMLGSIEATNGFIMFGWSTAFIFEIVSQTYRKVIKC